MKKERKENVWRTSGIKERDIDNVFHEWEENLQTHACPMNFVIDLAHRVVSVAQWQSIWRWNPKVWGAIPHGDSEYFSLSHARDKTKKKSFSIFKRNHNFFSVFWLLKRSIVITRTLSTNCYWKFIYIISNPVYRFSTYRPHAFISGITEKHREVITKGLKFS